MNEQPDLAAIWNEQWAMEPGHLGKLLEAAKRAMRLPAAELFVVTAPDAGPKVTRAGASVHIPVRGVLMKRVPTWLKYFGIEATAYGKVSEHLKAAVEDEGVDNIVLDVESPGGSIGGVQELADEIYEARKTKNIRAQINDIGASAAYWLASQAEEVSADPNAMVGSIGVYAAYYDTSKAFEKEGVEAVVIRSGEHKGMGLPGDPITKEQIKSTQAIIDGMAENFKAAVQRGRGLKDKQLKAVSDGQAWIAIEAKEKNLIDTVGNLTIERESQMAKENETAQAQATEAAKVEGAAAEKARFGELKAAFPADAAYAMDSFEKGLSVLEAKAAYADILQGRMKEMEKAKGKEKPEPKSAAQGAEPIPFAEGAQGAPDFVGEARRMAAAEGIPLDKAMSKLANSRPELHAAFLEDAESKRHKLRPMRK